MMYPVEVASLPPTMASVVQSTIIPAVSDSSSSSRNSSRRIHPIPLHVNSLDKRRHFHPSCMSTL
jgi:hypothetical protein